MAIEESAFQRLVLFFLNDINATSKELLKIQTKQLALLEALKDRLYEQNIAMANDIIEQLAEAYHKTSEISIETYRNVIQNDFIIPNSPH